jgi:hypothetical protein
MRNFKVNKGDRIAFTYDASRTGPADRVGVIEKVWRSKTTKDKFIVFTIFDETTGGKPKTFRFNSMRNIVVGR